MSFWQELPFEWVLKKRTSWMGLLSPYWWMRFWQAVPFEWVLKKGTSWMGLLSPYWISFPKKGLVEWVLTYPIDERLFGEGSWSVNSLAVILWTPRSRVDVNVAGKALCWSFISLPNWLLTIIKKKHKSQTWGLVKGCVPLQRHSPSRQAFLHLSMMMIMTIVMMVVDIMLIIIMTHMVSFDSSQRP